ncbi:hypothetical protein K435DRAFT_876195 [Dendrothele bispora CBS 962.96]|uniref:Uncharacterized protein n=1 Tax=Dendrothele bispora (strain CBS 962.96) TaxID=1314807 RepID=A0A4S8KSP2_DENBC|nr:hypothetical protein K435DRAFT_876195 [Dendrothele bispora CBS 962.96]
MPLDHTGLNANSPDTTGLASTESPLVPRKSYKPLGIDQSRANSPQTVVGPNSEEEHWNTSMSINVGPPASIHHDASPTSISLGSSASAPAVPSVSAPTAPSVSAPSSPSVRENNHHSNTPPSDNNNTNDQGQLNKAEDLTYLTSHQQPRRHLLLGRRPAPVTGPAETYDYTQIYEEDEPQS